VLAQIEKSKSLAQGCERVVGNSYLIGLWKKIVRHSGAMENDWASPSKSLQQNRLSAKQNLYGRASPFWTGTAESRKTVTSMLTRKDDQ
jgi:hypothetical protein